MSSPALLEFASPRMKRLVRTARDAADSSAPLLLGGERGAGKSVLAAAIHSWSPRRQCDYTVIPCAMLFEASFETRLLPKLDDPRGGTIVLDEIAELPAKIQTWLSSILKRRAERASQSDVAGGARIVATTRRDLDALTIAGSFRSDLLHLVNVVSIRVPSLRERPEDLPVLARHVLRSFAELHQRSPFELKPQALAALAAYAWPGNVRELVNVLDQAAHVCHGNRVQVEDLPECVRVPASLDGFRGFYEKTLPLRAVERQHIERVIATSDTLESAASRLGIALTTLWRKRKRYGI